MGALTAENYAKGLLVDEDLMAGVAESPDSRPGYVAFVLGHQTGEYLLFEAHADLASALERINRIPRGWNFEAAGGCGGGDCASGNCRGGLCAKRAACGTGCSTVSALGPAGH